MKASRASSLPWLQSARSLLIREDEAAGTLPPRHGATTLGRKIAPATAKVNLLQAVREERFVRGARIFDLGEPVCPQSSRYRVKARCGLEQSAQTHAAKFEKKENSDEGRPFAVYGQFEIRSGCRAGRMFVRHDSSSPITLRGQIHADERSALAGSRAASRRLLAQARYRAADDRVERRAHQQTVGSRSRQDR